MKFCKNCGRVIGDNEQCPCVLGDPASVSGGVPDYSAQQPYAGTQPQQPFGGYQQNQPAGFPPMYQQQGGAAAAKPGKKTGLIVVLAILILGLIGGGIWFFVLRGGVGGSYEKPVEQLFKGINQKNFKTCADTWTTDHLFQTLADYSFDGSLSDCKASFQEYCSEMKDEMEDFFEDCEEAWGVRNISYSYSIEGKNKLSKDDLRDIEDDNEMLYKGNDLQEGYELTLKVTVKGSGKSDSAKGTLTVVKSSKEGWKLLPDEVDGFNFSTFKDAEDLIKECLDL